MPDQALDELADTLVPPLLGIGAQASAAWRFARRWQVRTGASVSMHRRQRLYRLGQLAPADPPPPGRARRAVLFTDATNPVTNSIYQRLGYRPAEDRLILTFT